MSSFTPEKPAASAPALPPPRALQRTFSALSAGLGGPLVKLVHLAFASTGARRLRARLEAELRERTRLSLLRAAAANQLASGDPLERTLQRCCELLVEHLDAAFARVWVMNPREPMLELCASAGLYTHLDGAHARVPVGRFKIGRIAESRQPLFTNEVGRDPNISDPAWARREGMKAFAGYPLLIDDRVVGVLALFARQPLSPGVHNDLGPIAHAVSQCIHRKHAEADLRAVTENAAAGARAMAESAERLRLLAEVVSLQVWTARLDGTLDYVNHECAHYFGTGDVERDVLGHAWAQYVHAEDLPVALAAWKHSLATGERYEVEFRLRNGAGTYRWFLVRSQAMCDETGRILKWFGTNTDIHDLKTAQDEAERANRAKDEFLAALSHELRTPLTPVLMTAASLCEDQRLPANIREQLRMIERNIALEARLIDDLLDLTAISRGKLRLREQSCEAHSLINLAVEIVRSDALAKGIVIERDFEAQLTGLRADPARFQQVIWNLLRNAVKFTPPGGRIFIRTRDVAAAEGGNGLCIEVADSGIGITPEQIETIFLPFDQGGLTGNHRFGGVGLGLAIARAIVQLHGGKIRAESEGRDRGAVFIVDLPGAGAPPLGLLEPIEPLLPGLEKPAAEEGKAQEKSLRLLLVEDHEPTLQVLSRLLTRAGHTVVSTSSIGDALRAADREVFDGVISDLGLPDGTGAELMERLRDAHGLRGVALSGYGMEDDVTRSRQAGFVAHLTKPVDFRQLQRALVEFGAGA